MSKYRTVFAPEALDELRKMSREIVLRMLAKLTELEADPYGLCTTALVSQPARRRLRVGDYRIIYTVEADQLIVRVVHVGHRSTVNCVQRLNGPPHHDTLNLNSTRPRTGRTSGSNVAEARGAQHSLTGTSPNGCQRIHLYATTGRYDGLPELISRGARREIRT